MSNYEHYNSLILDEQDTVGYISDVDTHEILHITQAAKALYGFEGPENYLGQKCYELLQGLDKPCTFCLRDELENGKRYWEHYNQKLGRWMVLEDSLVELNGRKCCMEIAVDITDLKMNQKPCSNSDGDAKLMQCVRTLMQEMRYTNRVDKLTQVYNRNEYMRMLQRYEECSPNTLGVVFTDINGMKKINESHGHKYGDFVIVQTADILRKYFEGQVYRVSGDEFVTLCENVDQETFQEKVLRMKQEFETSRDCDASVGYVWQDGEFDARDEIVRADEMMYAQKQTYYQNVLSSGRKERIGSAGEVLKDIQEERFIVYLQPQVEIQTGRVVGAEALVRKRGHDGNIILPGKFIPFYEMEGIIRHLDFYVLETVCSIVRDWRQQDKKELRVSVNFSRMTLMEPDVVQEILRVCRRYQVPPRSINIEVTESISKMDYSQLQGLVNELTEAGFMVSLDDFGSKYSNLSILTGLNFHEVKFDISLVKELADNHRSQIVMKNAIQICKDFKTTNSLAEGIETREQLDLLAGYACDYGQGFYFSKALPAEEFHQKYICENQVKGIYS